MSSDIESSEMTSVDFSSETMTTTPNFVEEEDAEEVTETPSSKAESSVADDDKNHDPNPQSEPQTATTSPSASAPAPAPTPVTPPRSAEATTTTTTPPNNNTQNDLTPIRTAARRQDERQGFPLFSECLYGVPEDDELFETVFAQDHDDEDNDLGDTSMAEAEALWKRQARVPGHAVNLPQLRRLAALGIPDEGSHRGVVWRLLLGPYLPPDNIDEWPSTLQQRRSEYFQKCNTWFLWNDWTFGNILRVQRKQEHVKRMMRQMGGSAQQLVLNLDTDDEYQSMRITASAATAASQTDNNIVETADESSSHHEDDVLKQQQLRNAQTCRPTPSEWFDNPDVLDLIPQRLQRAWTDRGKDLHILQSIMKSFNALRLPDLESGDDNEAAISDFLDSAILLDEIRKDVVRTHSDLAFFLDPHDDLGRRRYAAIERILFLWAKFNKNGVRYVQGMNEIVGALYYVLANDWRTEWANAAEPDSYFLLQALLEDMKDVFVPELDAVDTGIRGRISALQGLLERHDPALQGHFAEVGIDASFYAVRWLTTLLSREFLLPDTIRLWDSMFASTHKDNFLRYVCVTMLFQIRERLLRGDFAQCIKLLQQYPPVHMDKLLDSSRSLYIYETQITVACHKANLTQHDALLTIKPPPNLIMAFGFEKGVAPPPTLSSSERVQNATSAVANSARNFYNRMFSRRRSSSTSSHKSRQTNRSDSNISKPQQEQPNLTTPPRPNVVQTDVEDDPDSPDIYMKAILQSSA